MQMRLSTIVIGCFLMLTSVVLLSNGFMEAVDFSSLVNMNWSTSTAFYTNPISLHFDTMHQTKVYAIIFDAGSTGTRVHVYKFRYGHNEAFPYVLVDELYEEVKPGLSSYAAQPEGVRPGLMHLLQCAKRKIPQVLWNRTWMTLKATAGLRLLPAEQAERILHEVEQVLSTSGLRLLPHGVSIMPGLEEGIWSWVTVNFLLQRVRNPARSCGIIDLGGGSVQITFMPPASAMAAATSSDVGKSIHRVQLAAVPVAVDIYSHSYLGLGLMSARHAILSWHSGQQQHNVDHLTSHCVPHGYRGRWTFGGVRYSVRSSAPANESLFHQCLVDSRLLVADRVGIHRPPGAVQRQFYLFSYFYDRAKDAGLGQDVLSADSDGARITPALYASLARQACQPLANSHHAYRKPFLCLDLTYIYALLTDGFQFGDTTVLHLSKKINNIELGWALGAVFDLLHHTEKV